MDPLADQPPTELTLAEQIPTAGNAFDVLMDILPSLPSQVIQIAHQLPDVLHMPDFEME